MTAGAGCIEVWQTKPVKASVKVVRDGVSIQAQYKPGGRQQTFEVQRTVDTVSKAILSPLLFPDDDASAAFFGMA